MKYGNEITGKEIRESIKSFDVENFNYESGRQQSQHKELELRFQLGYGDECKKGDFFLYVDTDRVYTRVILKSQLSRFSDDWTSKEWKLNEMVSKDWRFIEDKIRRAKKRMTRDTQLNMLYMQYVNKEWIDLV